MGLLMFVFAGLLVTGTLKGADGRYADGVLGRRVAGRREIGRVK